MAKTKLHFDFTDKRVLVTGGTRGIGRAAVEAFLGAGARVAVNGASDASVAQALEELAAGESAIAAPGDVSVVADCERIVAAAVEGLSGLDVLVNSAGVVSRAPIENCDEELWDETLDVNLKGTFFCIRAAVPSLRECGGNIVNLSSLAGLGGGQNLSVYCISKGGVVLLTQSLSVDLGPEVRINCVCPGYVDTDMVRRDYINNSEDPAATLAMIEEYPSLKRMAAPEEIAAAILYLASDAAGFVTGVAFPVDGGSSASL